MYQQLPLQQKVRSGPLAGQQAQAQRMCRHASLSAPLGQHEMMGSEEQQGARDNSAGAGQARRARHCSAGNVPDVFAHFEVRMRPAASLLCCVAGWCCAECTTML
jgi:hypothetical protein